WPFREIAIHPSVRTLPGNTEFGSDVGGFAAADQNAIDQ
ncbi:hypothetical protein M2432_000627, partial [Mycobacterium sp. OTB74]|nr:hypothetical protein [Mycobacterium sp. OTB74]